LLKLVDPGDIFSKVPVGSASGSRLSGGAFLNSLQNAVSFGCCELAKRRQRPHYAALRDFLATFLAVDPGSYECFTDGYHLVVPNGILGESSALSRFVVLANVEKCVSHNDEDTGTEPPGSLLTETGRPLSVTVEK
jgi:hypothetical protein